MNKGTEPYPGHGCSLHSTREKEGTKKQMKRTENALKICRSLAIKPILVSLKMSQIYPRFLSAGQMFEQTIFSAFQGLIVRLFLKCEHRKTPHFWNATSSHEKLFVRRCVLGPRFSLIFLRYHRGLLVRNNSSLDISTTIRKILPHVSKRIQRMYILFVAARRKIVGIEEE